jgi:hypothetical protein
MPWMGPKQVRICWPEDGAAAALAFAEVFGVATHQSSTSFHCAALVRCCFWRSSSTATIKPTAAFCAFRAQSPRSRLDHALPGNGRTLR